MWLWGLYGHLHHVHKSKRENELIWEWSGIKILQVCLPVNARWPFRDVVDGLNWTPGAARSEGIGAARQKSITWMNRRKMKNKICCGYLIISVGEFGLSLNERNHRIRKECEYRGRAERGWSCDSRLPVGRFFGSRRPLCHRLANAILPREPIRPSSSGIDSPCRLWLKIKVADIFFLNTGQHDVSSCGIFKSNFSK